MCKCSIAFSSFDDEIETCATAIHPPRGYSDKLRLDVCRLRALNPDYFKDKANEKLILDPENDTLLRCLIHL